MPYGAYSKLHATLVTGSLERLVPGGGALQPDNARGLRNLGAVYMAEGRFADALRALRSEVRLEPDNADAYSNLGGCFLYLRQYDNAVAPMEKAAELRPDDQALQRNLGDAYHFAGQAEKATAAYRRALEFARWQLDVNPKDWEAMASAALYEAHLDHHRGQALRQVERAMKMAPANHEIFFTAALIYEILGQRGAALQVLRSAQEKGHPLADIERTPDLDALRRDKRYQDWIERVKAGSEKRSRTRLIPRPPADQFLVPGIEQLKIQGAHSDMRRSTLLALVVVLSAPIVVLADDSSSSNSNCSGRVKSSTIFIDTDGAVFDSKGNNNYYPCLGINGTVTFAPRRSNGHFKAIFGLANPFYPQHDVLFTNHNPTGNITPNTGDLEYHYIACGAPANGAFTCQDPKIIVNPNQANLGRLSCDLHRGEEIVIKSEARLAVETIRAPSSGAFEVSNSCEGKPCVRIAISPNPPFPIGTAEFSVTYQDNQQVVEQTIVVTAKP